MSMIQPTHPPTNNAGEARLTLEEEESGRSQVLR